ncbi:MAG: hypothetical protein NZZ41_01695 [Candidatus Dojkabacteria bacterium]|nr:hypothetical protein [Candidatus Dojkabacteria bacterium]
MSEKYNLFSIIENILVLKNEDLIKNEEYFHNFNYFLLLKILSMNKDLLPICSYLNILLSKTILTRIEIHKLFLKVFPKYDAVPYMEYVKNTKIQEENTKYISEFFQCSPKEAYIYYNTYGNDFASEVKNMFGGKNNLK